MEEKFIILKPYGSANWEKQEFSHLAEIRNPVCPTEADLIKAVKGVHLLFADVDIRVTRRVLDAGDRLRAIVCRSTGIDYLDLPEATRKGILVTNLPDYCAEAVVEHALGLLFCLCRPIVRGVRAAFEGNWEERGKLQGIEVEGKTLGIIGLGRIGRRMAEKASGLGMKVIFYDPFVPGESVKTKGYGKTETLSDLVKHSDFVSIHASLISETNSMFGEEAFRGMKPTAYFLNVARGEIVDEAALYRALKEGWIAGAAVDVLSKEPPEKDHPLFRLDNILVTPHIGWNTQEALERSKTQVKEIVTSILQGRFPINVVNPEVRGRWNPVRERPLG